MTIFINDVWITCIHADFDRQNKTDIFKVIDEDGEWEPIYFLLSEYLLFIYRRGYFS